MTKPRYKKIQLFLALLTCFVLFASLYFQYIAKIAPCPLCLMQRLCVFLLLACTGFSFATVNKARVFSVIQCLIASAGLFFALRQLWLQSLPADKVPACMPGLDVLIRYFPWQSVAKALFWGAGDCAEASVRILGISMPAWSALYFLVMGCLGLLLYAKKYTH